MHFFANSDRERRYRDWAAERGLGERVISRAGKLLVGAYEKEVEEQVLGKIHETIEH